VIGQSRLTPNAVPGGVPYEMPKFSAMVPTPDTTGDFEEMCLPAGEAVTTIRDIKPAAQIVVEMMEEARAIIESRTGS
jgi:enoyl-[acyl-carrier protein] reductase II